MTDILPWMYCVMTQIKSHYAARAWIFMQSAVQIVLELVDILWPWKGHKVSLFFFINYMCIDNFSHGHGKLVYTQTKNKNYKYVS